MVLGIEEVGWARDATAGPLRMVLRRHALETMLGIEHHLLICPLGQLGVGLVDVRRWRMHLGVERLGGLLLELGLVEGRIERGGVYRRCPGALGLLLSGKGVWRLAHGCLLL